jgi:alpha-1,6-mannosyltransferase
MTSAVGPVSLGAEIGLTRSRILLVLAIGAALASQVWIAWAFADTGGSRRAEWPVALALCGLLAVPTALLLVAVHGLRGRAAGLPLLILVLLAGAMMRAPYFGAGPMLEDDHFRYLLDGAMVAHGRSPYALSPQDLLSGAGRAPSALIEPGRAMISAINFPDLRSIYPGFAQALFALAHLIDPWGVDGLRAVIFASEGLTTAVLLLASVRLGRSPLLVALYWCNPLMAFTLTGQAHIDAALAPAVLGALLAAIRSRGALAGLCLGLGVGVKLWPVLLAPLVLRALWPDRRAAFAFVLSLGAVCAAVCLPLVMASLSADAGLVAYAGGWSVNNAPFAWVSYGFHLVFGEGVGERLLRSSIALGMVGIALALAARPAARLEDLLTRAAILAAAVFYLAPAQFPWYAVWFLPLAAAAGLPALVAGTAALPVYFLFFPLAEVGSRGVHGYGLAFLHLVPVLAVTLYSLAPRLPPSPERGRSP